MQTDAVDDYCDLCGPATPRALCHHGEARTAWSIVPAAVRDEIDDLVGRQQMVSAIVTFRDKSGIEPKPTIPLGVELVDYRHGILLARGRITARPEITVESPPRPRRSATHRS